jgi:DNA mismatch repair protein MutL
MSDIIKLLPEHVANQIAAGEVVQRPASVVKELLENAIDAEATCVKLFVKDAGKTLIQVTDNGKGMSPQDARLCFERHATSKITSSDDLFRIHTKGFRGEALASIASVAQVEVKTRPGNDELGTHVSIEASKVINQTPTQCAEGTGFFVKNLFYNVPARRYFLKSDTIELRHMMDEFQRVALAHPDIEFHFSHNGNEVYQVPAASIRQRIVHILGSKYSDKLVPVEESTNIVTVNGFIGKPETAKKTRGEQFLFINQRFVKNTYLNHAVSTAFQSLIPSGTFPLYLLYLEIAPDQIDINIHPTKTEIKFQDERSVYAIIHAAIKRALGKFNIVPSLDFDQETSIHIEPMRSGAELTPPQVHVNTSFNPFEKSSTNNERSHALRGWFDRKSADVSGWQELMTVATEIERKQTNREALFSEEQHDGELSFMQHARKYVICSANGRVLVLHQQRAHQRVLFERFIHAINSGGSASQQLLFPDSMEFNALQWMQFNACREELESLGFQFENANKQRVSVMAIPTDYHGSYSSESLLELLQDTQSVLEYSAERKASIAWSMARSNAIKTGQMLTQPEMENLFQQLMRCSEPYAAQHQSPTMFQLDPQQLETYFQ